MVERLTLPSATHEETYGAAVDTISDRERVIKHHRAESAVLQESEALILAGNADRIELLLDRKFENEHVSVDELQDLFVRLRDNVTPRLYYDRILRGAKEDRCPYCSDRRPRTLDHYLPKSSFSALAVAPANLVPSCYECNSDKGNYEHSNRGRLAAVLHPYFDDLSGSQWLRANVVEHMGGPVARFYVDPGAIASPRLRATAATHLNALRLKTYFRIRSAQQFSGFDEILPGIYLRDGEPGVIEHLRQEVTQRAHGRLNCWERALFEGMMQSAWYMRDHIPGLARLQPHATDPRRPIAL